MFVGSPSDPSPPPAHRLTPIDNPCITVNNIFSDRIHDVPRSFIREILKVALDPTVISFAGGLPNRKFFPVDALKAATAKVFETQGADVFQYSNSEGHGGLREYIAARYKAKHGLEIPVENILITSGSQQGLDLMGKVLLNRGDRLILEEPGYLGAIQAFSIYRPSFVPLPITGDGMAPEGLRGAVYPLAPKLMYLVPNFQNPAGISYSEANRHAIAEVLQRTDTVLIEDDPYGDLRFQGAAKTPFYGLLPEQTVLLGSFSKTVVPGMRLGWLVAPSHIVKKLLIAKQATDLHTSHFTQSIVYHYLRDNDLDRHITTINAAYGAQCRAMIQRMADHFPADVTFTEPEGGMFLWASLPEGLSALTLFELAAAAKVVFVPGDPFYIDKTHVNTLRLNFSCVDVETIRVGIERLGAAIRQLSADTAEGVSL